MMIGCGIEGAIIHIGLGGFVACKALPTRHSHLVQVVPDKQRCYTGRWNRCTF
ncbi:putative beta-ketoacyl-[acyl-carrier-protein] synthase I [Helianthus debilis subsp. tardiflorus]